MLERAYQVAASLSRSAFGSARLGQTPNCLSSRAERKGGNMDMRCFRIGIGAGAIALVLICLSLSTAQQQTVTSRIVSAANSFLGTLDQKQRQSVLYAFDDQDQRRRWSNFPVAMVPRGGISLKEMNATQSAAAMALVASALSPRGFEKVQQIMEGDEVNKTMDQGRGGNQGGPGRRGGGGPPASGNGGPPPGNAAPPFGPGGRHQALFGIPRFWWLRALKTSQRKLKYLDSVR